MRIRGGSSRVGAVSLPTMARIDSFRSADRHTRVLLHFDTEPATAVLDDSGRQHNGTPVGSPQIVEEKR